VQETRPLAVFATGVDPFGVTVPLVRGRSMAGDIPRIGVDDFGAFEPVVSRLGARASLVVPRMGVDAFAEKLRWVAEAAPRHPEAVAAAGAGVAADPKERDQTARVASASRIMAPPVQGHDTRNVHTTHGYRRNLSPHGLVAVDRVDSRAS